MNARNFRKQVNREAFTFSELLVVIGTLVILGTVACGSMTGARDRTVIAQCESNLRQFGLATLIYGSDNSDRLPNQLGGAWVWDLPWAAGNSLNACGAPWQVMYCPGTASRFSWADNYALYNNYAQSFFHVIDYAVTFATTSLNPTNVNSSILPQSVVTGILTYPPPLPSKRVLLADATLNNAANGSGSWDSIQGGYNKSHTSAHMAGSIPAGGNVAFLDSHVEWRPFSQMTVRTAGTIPSFFW